MKTKLKNLNMTINLSSEDDAKKVILNLDNSITKKSTIISTHKSEIKSGLDLQLTEYFINENGIKSFQDMINTKNKEASESAVTIDTDELIDKNFDKIMINFRENYT